MRVIGIIPARWKSSRLEGKVLANLLGKPVIQHVWEKAKESKVLEDVIIATDSEKVMKVIEGFGGKVVFTSKDQPSGTDRIAEVVNPIDVDVIVNIQGDEPLIHHSMINDVANALLEDKSASMATVVRKLSSEEEYQNPNVVKAVIDKDGYALYFSRSPIPYFREPIHTDPACINTPGRCVNGPAYKHIGLYAYTKDFLFTYTNLPKSKLEEAEKLEQLRALENGYKIKTVETDFDTIGVDTAEDLKKVEEILKKQ